MHSRPVSERTVGVRVRGLLVAAAAVSGVGTPAFADDISWVGYQGGPPYIFRDNASWFHGDQWFNYLVPDADDAAIFDNAFDPQGNGMPNNVYFGDYFVSPEPPVIPPPGFLVPGGDATAGRLAVLEGSFNFRFTTGGGVPQGSLAIVNSLIVSARDGRTAELTLHDGPVTASYLAVSGSQTGVSRVTLENASLSTPGSLVDIGVLGGRGEVVVGTGSLLRAGYTRVGENAGSNGLLRVVGAGARAEVDGMQIGASSTGRLEVLDGGELVSTSTVYLANFSDGSARGAVVVEGTGSTMEISAGGLVIGDSGTGSFEISDSGTLVSSQYIYVGGNGQSESSLRVSDAGSSARTGGLLWLDADRSDAKVEVERGGVLRAASAQLRVAPDQIASKPEASVRVRTGALAAFDSNVLLDQQEGAAILDAGTTGRVHIGNVSTPATDGEIRIGSGGTLSGNGKVIGSIVVEAGGMVSPGLSPGVLDVEGALTLLLGSTLFMQIAGDLPASIDQLLLSGDVTLGGALVLEFSDGFVPQPGSTFALITAGGMISGSFDVMDIRGIDPSLVSIRDVGGVLSVDVVPTPSAVGVLMLGGVVAVRRRQ